MVSFKPPPAPLLPSAPAWIWPDDVTGIDPEVDPTVVPPKPLKLVPPKPTEGLAAKNTMELVNQLISIKNCIYKVKITVIICPKS